jgi:hypothetical protein
MRRKGILVPILGALGILVGLSIVALVIAILVTT